MSVFSFTEKQQSCYRQTLLGIALEKTIKDMGCDPEPFMLQFDQVCVEALTLMPSSVAVKLKGDMEWYKCIEEQWTFQVTTPIKLMSTDFRHSNHPPMVLPSLRITTMPEAMPQTNEKRRSRRS
jgi:hypothetical protein